MEHMQTIETLTGAHTMRALTLAELSAIIRGHYPPAIADAMLGVQTQQTNRNQIAETTRADAKPIARAQKDGGTSERGTKLRTLADAMQAEIDRKRNPATANQNLTRRRMGIIDSMRRDAERMEQTQTALYALADAHDAGTVPEGLGRLSAKTEINGLLFGGFGDQYPGKAHQQRLLELMANYKPVNAEERAAEQLRAGIREREKRAALLQIPGYFPTPPDLARQIVELADIRPGMRVLEPSAGSGHLADEIQRQTEQNPFCIEQSGTLHAILTDKGYHAIQGNFLQYIFGADEKSVFDRIVMNPPFENGQDIDHIRHAFSLLKPGGVLAAILCEGPFYREDAKSRGFRAWLAGTGDPFVDAPEVLHEIKNEDGAFLKSDRSTGVATRILVLRKEA
jgi:predicted RNA methylase